MFPKNIKENKITSLLRKTHTKKKTKQNQKNHKTNKIEIGQHLQLHYVQPHLNNSHLFLVFLYILFCS